jgi:hypothetical protein
MWTVAVDYCREGADKLAGVRRVASPFIPQAAVASRQNRGTRLNNPSAGLLPEGSRCPCMRLPSHQPCSNPKNQEE